MAQTQSRATEQQAPEALYLNRELSVLEYMSRVLAIAEDRERPLLERVQFLAMSSFALDDFFQIRVAGLREQLLASPLTHSLDGLTPSEQLRAIRERVESLVSRHSRLVVDELQPALEAHGMAIVGVEALDKADADHLTALFRKSIFPVLTPLAVDPGHPFPYISNLSLNLAVLVRDPLRRTERFARIKVPPLLPRFVALPDGERFVPLEQVIAANLQALFPGMEIVGHHEFRVTRDADLDLVESEAEDLLAAVQTELRRQRRRAPGVRLEVREDMPAPVREVLMRELELGETDVYEVDRLLDLNALSFFAKMDRPELKAEPWTPVTQPRLAATAGGLPDFFEVLREGDVLVHHPYDSFATSVEAFIAQAAADPDVLAIKQTLYRTSGPASQIARSLVAAAESGKQVVALVELKARGDEQANIAWAGLLEEAGVHVVYGLVGLKTHAKVSLVVRREADGIRRYVHIGTGNYNAVTAGTYEDVGLLSADSELGADVTEFFNYLTGYSRQRRYRRLLVSPVGVRNGLLALIERESRRGGRIVLKVNNLVDQKLVDALYAAGRAGASIDLVVRGMCALRPGVKGLSENIRVRSIVGRFLEHSRVLRFGAGELEADYLIGSPDLMERNLDRRVETMVPVTDRALRAELAHILEGALADDTLAWELQADGRWRRVGSGRAAGARNLHEELKQRVLERSLGS